MRVIIAGSRWIKNAAVAECVKILEGAFEEKISLVVSGGAPGVDACGEAWAKANGVPVKVFPADWDKHGKKAGPLRNREMAKHADALLLIWDGQSRGSASMKHEAEKAGLALCEFKLGFDGARSTTPGAT